MVRKRTIPSNTSHYRKQQSSQPRLSLKVTKDGDPPLESQFEDFGVNIKTLRDAPITRTRSTTDSQITHIMPPRTLDNLPLELFWLMTEYLHINSLGALRCVSKTLKAKTKTAWLCSRVHPLSIHIDPEDGGRMRIRPEKPFLAPRPLPRQYQALLGARQLILETYECIQQSPSASEAALITLCRILSDNAALQPLALQRLTLCARDPRAQWLGYHDSRLSVRMNPFRFAGPRAKFSAHWAQLTQLIVHLPGALTAEGFLNDLVGWCILPHAPRLEDFRLFCEPRHRHRTPFGYMVGQLAQLNPRPPLKRLEINFHFFRNYRERVIDVLQAYGRTLETVTIMCPYQWAPDIVELVVPLKAACPVLAHLLEHIVDGEPLWRALSGPAELYEERPRDDDGSLEWVRVDGSPEWQEVITHVTPL
ncbi:hypothetical protein BO86DRAFT_459099 [Aspergillus japonicus CBS 114.51]|uniref:F-box domain-containing protein n=1 Tax=Aspergillus japonicus CBS 114.51 TaxID=1448312 RepID=A0A8T8WP55_ASPJA|nr:hypothetical protein BO86DRAFT_459099 [Aspergillus japonicus CBS 114.51]RAH77608.1 hypothetical protein BO86DRAFT_459099 [Aspergillus japonicus CBS 114.51]